jgi:hypothetical protein
MKRNDEMINNDNSKESLYKHCIILEDKYIKLLINFPFVLDLKGELFYSSIKVEEVKALSKTLKTNKNLTTLNLGCKYQEILIL